ncbi:4Fe-4S binding protein [Gordonibacter massiliensis (ex Traore et al. 2017)]|uniref:4Fe-4S binding protein n=1 Tax=Gordonibacter massiliensis (ex Traore et al. 2017) TaxID=1841863 RepID=A0A842JA97_9ACTN|nr:4Fe-4S binding protein [Gordonibacter massiliensis (ex Traore et al. 2017)]MBC2888657.1 4Fe-4S binding protein [Gordonibacter massiliensis (ex Traore et al. 2017)]
MPNLIDIVEVAEALESKAVFLAPDRCTVVRNRHSSCRKCSDACPTDAVGAVDNVLSLDSELCVACGACTVVCPTEALIPLQPLDEDLAEAVANAVVAAGGRAVFACARIASKHLGDPSKFAEVPCLARMEESVLLELAARDVRDIQLVDGTCSTCKFRANVPGIDATVASANQLLAAQGSDIRVERASAFPDDVLLEDKRSLLGASRRGFFSQAKGTALTAAEKTVEVAFIKKGGAAAQTLRERLRMSDAGTLPQFNPVRRMHVLDAMDSLGPSVVPEIDTRLFGSVQIDAEACSSCGMCAVFCPTGALKKSDLVPEEGEGSFLEFSASDCVQCNLCADACLKSCLEVSSVVSTDELFDFEPRLIHLPNPPARPGILSSLKR